MNGKRVYIQEVATRDGFQNEAQFVDTDEKIALIDRLSACGYAKIEVTSFTSPKAIPALRDAEAVMHGIKRQAGVIYTVLVPNIRGAERALSCAVDEVNLVMSVSESHNRTNLRMSREQSFAQLRDVIGVVKQTQVAINVSLSTAMGCPMEGAICLLADTSPVAFGSLGLPISLLSKVTNLPVESLSMMVGRQTPLLALFVPLILIGVADGKRGVKEVWPLAVLAGAVFASAQCIGSSFLPLELVDIISALSATCAALLFLKVWQPKSDLRLSSSGQMAMFLFNQAMREGDASWNWTQDKIFRMLSKPFPERAVVRNGVVTLGDRGFTSKNLREAALEYEAWNQGASMPVKGYEMFTSSLHVVWDNNGHLEDLEPIPQTVAKYGDGFTDIYDWIQKRGTGDLSEERQKHANHERAEDTVAKAPRGGKGRVSHKMHREMAVAQGVKPSVNSRPARKAAIATNGAEDSNALMKRIRGDKATPPSPLPRANVEPNAALVDDAQELDIDF
ncbi:hydroxymethylglutaryl-CoA lyase [Caballeronia hypogeia]|uniref:L-lactate permease n=1 Tax=Caballeronia hypogeia TaxID=1777140 RepID=A0A158DTS3_9BURK|nr:L-lactate permease [Caballeronia hypogeia]SAK97995.1 hydroxymethylglutaryl-CoA lyase [Caballeronia hypogeia]